MGACGTLSMMLYMINLVEFWCFQTTFKSHVKIFGCMHVTNTITIISRTISSSGQHALCFEFHGNSTIMIGSGHHIPWKEICGNNTILMSSGLSSKLSS